MSNMTDCGGGASGGGISTISNTSNSNGSSSSQQPPQPPPSKKKRNLPGNPDPTSEVIALSPNTLMTTNRFVCEICNKGFQRDQNLQLHRRGHNLPWKLKQRNSNDLIRKKVYICPESSCVHHNPSRALGDLTGIKKHFCRKHGEKRWKCEKCSKKYAVQSDWKAHAKTCGTKEYKCDCGTIFSRRDSFITHRAFCDALAEENNKANSLIHQPPHIITQIHLNNNQYELNINNINNSDPKINTLPLNMNMMNSFNNGSASMSATALLLKASQMGSTTATGSISTMAPSSFGPMYDQIGHFFNGTDLGTVRSNGENQSRGDDESTTMVDFLGINRGNLQQQDQMDQFVAGNLQGMNHFHEALGNLCHTRARIFMRQSSNDNQRPQEVTIPPATEKLSPLQSELRRRLFLGISSASLVAVGANFGGITSLLLGLSPQSCRDLKLDAIYPNGGYSRSINEGFG